MSSNFGTLKTNVGNRVGDTGTPFATIIGTYINQRYKDILRRCNWSVIDEDYQITAASGTRDYTLPSNFGKELYVWDTVQKIDIPRISFEKLEQEYQSELKDTGTVQNYTIIQSTTDTSDPSAARTQKLRLFRTPDASAYFDVPYILYPMDMSASSEIPVMECERAIEYGATCDAWMYKRQFVKAQAYEQLYEKEIQNLMFNKDNNPNETPLMSPMSLSRDEGI